MKVIASNKRAKFDYDITDTVVAGLVLLGSEVKSIKNGLVSIKGSYVRFVDGEPVLTGSHVSPYPPAGELKQHEPERDRKILLNKNEIQKLKSERQNGRHIIPTRIGIIGKFVKLELGIGTARKKYDKREAIKKRESQRQIARAKNSKSNM
ncbi:MAG: SsrA-binding protein SmpB [Candidatus Saccharimonadales bacterium]